MSFSTPGALHEVLPPPSVDTPRALLSCSLRLTLQVALHQFTIEGADTKNCCRVSSFTSKDLGRGELNQRIHMFGDPELAPVNLLT